MAQGDVTTGDVTTGDVTAGDVTAGDVTTGDVTAGDMTTAGLAGRRVRRHGRTVHNRPRAAPSFCAVPSFRVTQDRRAASRAGEGSGEG